MTDPLILQTAATEASSAATGSGYFEPLLLLGFVAIFYFLIWRPQSKRTKEHRALVAGLAVGDEVVTSGGIAGRIRKLEDNFVLLEVASGVVITLQQHAVTATLPANTLKALAKNKPNPKAATPKDALEASENP